MSIDRGTVMAVRNAIHGAPMRPGYLAIRLRQLDCELNRAFGYKPGDERYLSHEHDPDYYMRFAQSLLGEDA